MTRTVTILGATGSVGRSTVALLEAAPDGAFAVEALVAGRDAAALAATARRLRARLIPGKTHEGELAMTTVPGTAPVVWPFTISSDIVASQLTEAMGKRVILHYKEYRPIPTACFGETTYFVDKVEIQE